MFPQRLRATGQSIGGVVLWIAVYTSTQAMAPLMSYFELTTEQREEIGISDSLVRLSVGVEACEDLVADLSQALDAAFG